MFDSLGRTGLRNRLYTRLDEGGRRDGKPGGLSARTIRYVHTLIRSALQHAVKVGRVTSNVADRATPPSAGEAKAEEMRTWTSEQLGRFLSRIPDDRYRPALVFLATTGCRRGEALRLRWQDVALEEGRASIRQTITAVGHAIHAATRTKAGKRKGRQVELDARTVAVLRSWKAHHAKERLAMGEGYQDSGLFFCHPDGRPLRPEQFSREFEKRVRSVGLPAIRLHDLRQTWATLALKAGISVKVVSERLGHRSTLITSDIYSHVTPTMQSDAAEKVAGLIFGDTVTNS